MAVLTRPKAGEAVTRGYRRLLVPLIGNAQSLRAVEVACTLASDRYASVSVVSVLEVPPLLPLDAHMLDEEAEARRLFDRAEAIADAHGVHVSSRLVRAREAGPAIVELLEDSGTELVVVGAGRRRGGGFGRTVRHVLRKASCRVLLVAATSPAARGT